jgi:hypothetical protein
MRTVIKAHRFGLPTSKAAPAGGTRGLLAAETVTDVLCGVSGPSLNDMPMHWSPGVCSNGSKYSNRKLPYLFEAMGWFELWTMLRDAKGSEGDLDAGTVAELVTDAAVRAGVEDP